MHRDTLEFDRCTHPTMGEMLLRIAKHYISVEASGPVDNILDQETDRELAYEAIRSLDLAKPTIRGTSHLKLYDYNHDSLTVAFADLRNWWRADNVVPLAPPPSPVADVRRLTTEPNTNQVRKAAAYQDRDFVVTFEGWAAVRVETVSPITGDLRTIWTPGRPVGQLTKAAISNARMRAG